MLVLDANLPNVVMPQIATHFGIRPTLAAWIAGANPLATATTLLTGVALCRARGFDSAFRLGLTLSMAGAWIAALAPSISILVAARLLQGVGAAALFAAVGPLLMLTYTGPQLGRGLGRNAIVVALATAASPLIASLIFTVAGWRILFIAAQPLAITALLLSRSLAASRSSPEPIALRGHAMGNLGLGLMFAAMFAGGQPALLPLAITIAVAAMVCLHRFVAAQRRLATPLLPIPLLKTARFRMAYLASIVSFTGQGLAMVTLPFVLHARYGLAPLQVGLTIAAWPGGVIAAAFVAGRLADRMPHALQSALGMLIATAGMAAAAITPAGRLAWLLASLCMVGIGFAVFQIPNNRAMLANVPSQHQAGAGGMQSMCRFIGQTFGAAAAAFTLERSAPAASLTLVVAAAFLGAAGLICARRALNDGFIEAP